MRSRVRHFKRNRASKMWHSFFVLVGGLVGCYILIASVVVFAFIRPSEENSVQGFDYTSNSQAVNNKETDKEKSFKNTYLIPPKITTALILGTDQSNMLADVIMLAFFNSETGDVDIVNIPRDLYAALSDELEKEIKDEGKYIPKAMKITELHSYAGSDMGDYAVKKFLNQEFDISIDYTVNISLESFRRIVDIVGPITMEIPAGGLNYYDPDQNLRINVPGGIQQLDGEMAEGVVRYRATYQRGDLQRIEVQQEFMKLLFKQVLDKGTLISNAPAILSTIIEFVETDFKIIEAPKYFPYVSKLSADKFETRTLPGEAKYLYSGETGVSYYIYDPVTCTELFDSIIYASAESEAIEIQVFNGGADEERFNEIVAELEKDGYVVFVSDNGNKTAKETQITLTDTLNKKDFDKYFNRLILNQDEEMPEGFEAVIIIGSNE